MIVKTLLLSASFFVIAIVGTAQSIYQFNYRLPRINDTTTYSALLVLFNDGTGLLRERSISPISNAVLLKQMDVQEQYPDETTDTISSLFYKLSKPRFIKGSDNREALLPIISFKSNAATKEFEPYGIGFLMSDFATYSDTLMHVQTLQSKDLKEDFVLQYFNKEEEFYQKLFKSKTRGLSIFEKQTRLFLIAVANINDTAIGKSCLKDRDRIIETFKNVTDTLGIKLDVRSISGTNYNKANVESEINMVSPSKNDIVVFYYTGHGFRKDKDTRNFPYIDLRPIPDGTFNENSLNIEDVYNTITRKGARLNLIISDCCNTAVEASNTVASPVPRKKGALSWSVSNCQTLFLNPKPTSILITAADRDQKAASNNDFGGFFSYFFKTSLEDHFAPLKLNVTWESVLKQARKQTIWKAQHTYCSNPHIPQNICNQNPVATVNNRSLLF